MDCEQPWGEGPGDADCWEAQHYLTMHTGSPDSQQYPGLNQKKRDKQLREVILSLYSAPLRSHLCPVTPLWGPHHKKDTDLWEEGHEDTKRTGASLPWRHAEKVVVV